MSSNEGRIAADEGGRPLWQGTAADARSPFGAEPPSAVIQKSRVVAVLLALFGGMIGLHKFYLGYYQTAFMMMAVSIVGGIITFGLAAAVVWVMAIVEGGIYAAHTQEDFERTYVVGRRDWF